MQAKTGIAGTKARRKSGGRTWRNSSLCSRLLEELVKRCPYELFKSLGQNKQNFAFSQHYKSAKTKFKI